MIPAGTGNTEQQIEAISHFKPAGGIGLRTPSKFLLDAASQGGKDAFDMKHALVSGAALSSSLRQEFTARGVEVLQCYATAEAGVIAYESEAREG